MALWFWKRYPTQIESDLSRFHPNLDISDWHTGELDSRGWPKLSSRKLLTLIEHLPLEGAFKMALMGREGDWPEETEILADIHKWVTLGYAAKFHPGERVQTYLSPKAREQYYTEQSEAEEFADRGFDGLMGDLFGNE